MVFQPTEHSMRVNGALLPMYAGQQVVLAGTVAQIDSSGSSLTVKASDGEMVKVTLPNPLQDNLEGMVEVHGVAQGKQVMAQSVITFPQMQADDFDANLYNEAITRIHGHTTPWKTE
ncbi:uncharacterized protein LOC126982342 [Eriocheir sinensis]|uniref:uncharacterized protein LOC126982342 n=1 Tax=Eriocheir sinensis TaxID=95602 RepID=UPI0021CA8AFC|nr:uncharacterized protein LOC126982342 [Eriocheir sinensis]